MTISGNVLNESQMGEFPWTVAILIEEHYSREGIEVFKCSGSLIHPGVVLTAARCVFAIERKNLKIRAGEWDTRTTDEFFPHQDRTVSDIVVHEEFDIVLKYNDVALLFLSEPLTIAENVNTVCLPPKNHVFENNQCIVTGWGQDLYNGIHEYQVILREVELPLLPHHMCEQRLRNTGLGTSYELSKSSICAGGDRESNTCLADRGSALVCRILGTENRYYQAGIFSWDIGCESEPSKFDIVTDLELKIFINIFCFLSRYLC